MKKLVLVLFSLIFFLGAAFAACGANSVIYTVDSPVNNESFSLGVPFTLQISADTFAAKPCDTDLEFQYDEETGGASFIRIKDNSPFNPPTNFVEAQDFPGNITFYPTFTIADPTPAVKSVSLVCNKAGTYILKVYSSEVIGISTEVTINCLSNSPPNGQFLVPAFDTVIYKKDNETGAPDAFPYTIQWEANDAEDTLKYDIRVIEAGNPIPYDSASGLVVPSYQTTISDFNKFTFEVDIIEDPPGTNTTTIYSETVFVKEQNFSTLSIEDLNVFPESLQGNEKIYASVTVRNNSPDTVDINALFNFFDFPGEQYAFPGCPTCAQANVPPFSKATLYISTSTETGHTLSVDPGDYNIHIVIQERLVGSTAIRNEIQSFGHFVGLYPTKPVSVPETNFISVILVSLVVILITTKKRNNK